MGDARAALSGGDAVTLRRRTPFLLRGAGSESAELLLVFVPDGVTVAQCDDMANAGGPVDPLPPDPAHPPLQVVHLAETPAHTIANGHGEVRMLLDPQTPAGSTLAYLGELHGDSSFAVPEHVHAGAAELLLLVAGRGQLKIGTEVLPVSAGMAIYIPPDTPHSFQGEREMEAVQVYAPPGAEDRFRSAPLATP
jgi:mannose-6-phosphate isomerase-like protein (cupin superfamily)